jgi:hypothetical protein
MDPVVSIAEHTEFLDRLGASLPSELNRFGTARQDRPAKAVPPVVLRFTYRDVPFIGRIQRQYPTAATLHLTGEIGPLPFSAKAARRRRRALATLAAGSDTGLTWRVSAQQEVTVEGTITLAQPLTPAATVAGALQLLLQGDCCLSLLLDVLGDADELNSSLAA